MNAKKAKVDRTFAALSDANRRRVMELLRSKPLRAGEIATALKLAPPALSRHLKTLRDAGLIEETHPDYDARIRIFSMRVDGLADLRKWLDETEKLAAQQAKKKVAPSRRK